MVQNRKNQKFQKVPKAHLNMVFWYFCAILWSLLMILGWELYVLSLLPLYLAGNTWKNTPFPSEEGATGELEWDFGGGHGKRVQNKKN